MIGIGIWIENGPSPPLEFFPKIHPLWCGQLPSVRYGWIGLIDNDIKKMIIFDDRGHFWSKRARPGQFWSKRSHWGSKVFYLKWKTSCHYHLSFRNHQPDRTYFLQLLCLAIILCSSGQQGVFVRLICSQFFRQTCLFIFVFQQGSTADQPDPS